MTDRVELWNMPAESSESSSELLPAPASWAASSTSPGLTFRDTVRRTGIPSGTCPSEPHPPLPQAKRMRVVPLGAELWLRDKWPSRIQPPGVRQFRHYRENWMHYSLLFFSPVLPSGHVMIGRDLAMWMPEI